MILSGNTTPCSGLISPYSGRDCVKSLRSSYTGYLRLIDFCITQLKAQGPSRTCNESKEEWVGRVGGLAWRARAPNTPRGGWAGRNLPRSSPPRRSCSRTPDHAPAYHSTLGLRVIKKKKHERRSVKSQKPQKLQSNPCEEGRYKATWKTPMAQGRSARIISMTKWNRTSRLSIRLLSLCSRSPDHAPGHAWRSE